jgi:hypothetical protein
MSEYDAEAAAELDALDDDYQSAEAADFDWMPPDGDIECRIGNAQLKTIVSKKTGETFRLFEMRLQINAGSLKGKTFKYTQFLTANQNLGMFKKNMLATGHAPKQLSQLADETYCFGFRDRIVSVTVKRSGHNEKTNSPYVNVYINKLLKGPPGEAEKAADIKKQLERGEATSRPVANPTKRPPPAGRPPAPKSQPVQGYATSIEEAEAAGTQEPFDDQF